MKVQLFALAAVAALGLAAPAQAAPLNLTRDVAAVLPDTNVEQVHLRHRTCQLGTRGWHFHDRWGNRIVCRPFRRRY